MKGNTQDELLRSAFRSLASGRAWRASSLRLTDLVEFRLKIAGHCGTVLELTDVEVTPLSAFLSPTDAEIAERCQTVRPSHE
jgi:hypothetical protein